VCEPAFHPEPAVCLQEPLSLLKLQLEDREQDEDRTTAAGRPGRAFLYLYPSK